MIIDDSLILSQKVVKAMICFLCQKEFNVKKIDSHVQACKKKWDEKEEKKRPEYRLPRPKEPQGFRETIVYE